MTDQRHLLVLSGGHPYDETAFAAMLSSLDHWIITHLRHPEAEAAIAQGAASRTDAILFYDMGGYDFQSGQAITRAPSCAFRTAITDYFARGGGAVAMHHSLAGWAAWPAWADMLGGRFLYQSDTVHGQTHLDSGYRHDVCYEAVVLDQDHAVTAGLPPRFELCDELYLAPIWDAAKPRLRADHRFVRDNFYSAAQAVAGTMYSNKDWDHPPECDVIAWEKTVNAGRLVYLQPGDGPATYANPSFRRLLMNALNYVAFSATSRAESSASTQPNENAHGAVSVAEYSPFHRGNNRGRDA